jgi:ribosomal protein S18 acetylase RimI-like enzyme
MPLALRSATSMDLPLLVRMNQELIEDEGSSNPMNPKQLETRMQRWLHQWQIDLFIQDTLVIGYTIYRPQQSETDDQKTTYIRHYYISREHRRQGLGHKCFKLLQQERFPPDTKIYLEVLWHNQRGREFWKAMGFSPYSLTMKI